MIGSIHIHVGRLPASQQPSGASTPSFGPGGEAYGQTIGYVNVRRVTERVERVLKGRIAGLKELVVQVEGEGTRFCGCLTG